MKVLASEQDWETVDDDGFVYKRAKRERREEEDEGDEEEEEEEDGNLNPEETVQQRREELLRRKEMYAAELRMWDELLSTQKEINAATVPPPLPSAMADSPAIMLGEPHYEPYEQLLQQVQDLEFFIRKYTSVCERADDLLGVLNDKIKSHTLQNLRSPRQIFLSTSD